MNDVMSAEVWTFFCKKKPNDNRRDLKQRDAFSKLEWAAQVQEMISKLVRSSVVRFDDFEVEVRIPLMTQIFQLVIQKTSGFPYEAPNLCGDFIEGFNSFEWNSKSTLYNLTETITDYYTTTDLAILEIKEADTDGFQLIELEIDEGENRHMLVQMKALKYNETITLSLDIENVRFFPRILRCSNYLRTASFDCETWISDDKLGSNLRRLYGDLDQNFVTENQNEKNSHSDKDSFDDEDLEIMDFI